MTMEWQDPPERTRSSKWKSIADELATRPGDWGLLNTYEGENAKRNAYSLAGRVRKLFGKGYEVTSRTTGPDTAGVWGRKRKPDASLDSAILDALADEDTDIADLVEELS